MCEGAPHVTVYYAGEHAMAIATERRTEGWVYWVYWMPGDVGVAPRVIPEDPNAFLGYCNTEEEARAAGKRAADTWSANRDKQ